MNLSGIDHQSLLNLYADDVIELLASLENFRLQKNEDEMLRILHKLKGASGYVGAEQVVTVCNLLSGAISHHDNATPALCSYLKRSIRDFLHAALPDSPLTGC